MSVEEFYNNNDKKYSLDLINKWLKNGYIRGAKKINNLWYIPKEALPPYTRNGNPKGMGIYKSIIRGIINGYDVFGKLYRISDLRFEIYINQLEKAGYLYTYESEGIVYCTTTLISKEFLNINTKKILRLFGEVYETIKS